MKSVARFSAWLTFAALLCFATSAFGQGTASIKATGAGSSVLSQVPAAFFVLAFDHHDHKGNNGGGNDNGNNVYGTGNVNSNACGTDDAWGGNCKTVPEGGTSLGYLSLVGLCFLGAMVLRSRQQVRAGDPN
jgi:hypothetical protein